jgi:hypothetical protein
MSNQKQEETKPLSPLEQARLRKAQRLHAEVEAASAEAEAKELRELEHEDKAHEEMAKAEAKHGKGRVGFVMTPSGPVVLKAPHQMSFAKFQDAGANTFQGCVDLAIPSLCYPSLAEFEKILELHPAQAVEFAGRVCILGGQRVAELGKK